jgi:Holliday junction resolvasome RuvABC endonuclease subunit
VNDFPEKNSAYPYNIIDAANNMAILVADLCDRFKPDVVVIENTVRGRNRNTQRLLEFIHKSVLDFLRDRFKIKYLDPSEWRKILEIRLSNDDKKNNRLVSAGKKRGRITKKHLSVRMANQIFDLKLKIKDNDVADALCLAKAYILSQGAR